MKLFGRFFLLFIFLFHILLHPLFAENKVLQTKEVIVIFEEHQAGAAEEVSRIYPSVKSELVEN